MAAILASAVPSVSYEIVDGLWIFSGGGGCRTQYRHGVLSAADRLRDRHGDRRETENRALFGAADGSESLHDRAGD